MEISKITSPGEWVFFAKGNANILFEYVGAHDYLRRKLLRLRLFRHDEEYISTCELYDFIELKCKPLFPRQIIDIELVVLTTEFCSRLDARGSRLMVRERYGLLLPNALHGDYERQFLSKHCQLHTPRAPQIDVVIFEFKPKWLYDNTSSNYCRTCSHCQLTGRPRHFCPLDLLYPDTVDRGIDDVFSHIPAARLAEFEQNRIPLRRLLRTVLSQPDNVFQRLKQCQRINNKNDLIKNLGSPADVSHNLSLVMTLRDVGLFLKFEKYNRHDSFHNSHNNARNLIDVDGYGRFLSTCHIYDLDLKSPMKYRHWLRVEQQLQSVYTSENPQWHFCTRRGGEDMGT
ncbi:Inositol-pentakisphosphate 2-kinase [[Candida] zeylanoides]